MRPVDIDYIYCKLKNQKMTGEINPGDIDEAYYQVGWNNALCRVDMILEGTPTLDVEPVRHGQWVFKYPNGWACSECGTWGLKTDQLGICKSKYCPECGAIMDLPS